MSSFKVGVIVGSTRNTRICPKVCQYVVDTIESQRWTCSFNLSIIDLKHWDLPMFDESKVPSQIKRSEDYEHEHSRKWSAEISSCDAFIFVTPQYNWGYPACLKNAIDYLYNEWAAKPAMMVTYASRGGNKCYAQLKQVLDGIHMKVTEKGVLIPYPTKEEILHGIPDDFSFDNLPGVRENVLEAFQELLTLL